MPSPPPFASLADLLVALARRPAPRWSALAAATDVPALAARAAASPGELLLLRRLFPADPIRDLLLAKLGTAFDIPSATLDALRDGVRRVRDTRPAPDPTGEVADWIWERRHEVTLI